MYGSILPSPGSEGLGDTVDKRYLIHDVYHSCFWTLPVACLRRLAGGISYNNRQCHNLSLRSYYSDI